MTRILIVAPAWVGDAVLAQPLFMRLRERDPGAIIDVLAPAWTLPVFRRMPQVAEAIAGPFAHGELGLAARWRIARELAARRYERAIVLPNSWKSALVPFFAGIPVRTGYVGELRHGLLNDARRLDEQALPQMAERFAALAEARDAPLERPVPHPALAVGADRKSAALGALGLPAGQPAAVLCPGAEYGTAKRWPPEHFAQLAEALAGHGLAVWLVGSAKDSPIAQAIVRAARTPVVDLCGRTDLAQAIDVIACARLVVSNDSGLMHIAAALDRPLTAIYGSSSPAFTPPLSPLARIVKLDVPCSPCFERECPLGHFRCMRELTPGHVLSQIDLTGLAAP
jgi:heptosyltransferase-2